jgi:hypothetical protein
VSLTDEQRTELEALESQPHGSIRNFKTTAGEQLGGGAGLLDEA